MVAAHGAGLTNIVFGPPSLRVLELNLDLDGRGFTRPWFLLLACTKGQHYQYLDHSSGEITAPNVAIAFERLCARNRGARLKRWLFGRW